MFTEQAVRIPRVPVALQGSTPSAPVEHGVCQAPGQAQEGMDKERKRLQVGKQRLCEAGCEGQGRRSQDWNPSLPNSKYSILCPKPGGGRVSQRDGGSGLTGGVMQMRLNGLIVCGLRGQEK